jgi:hypothetical protein
MGSLVLKPAINMKHDKKSRLRRLGQEHSVNSQMGAKMALEGNPGTGRRMNKRWLDYAEDGMINFFKSKRESGRIVEQ